MKHIRHLTLAGVAYIAAGRHAGSMLREPVHLRVAADESWKSAVEASISNLVLVSPVTATHAKAAGDEEKKGDKGKKTDQPVQVQVPDNELDQFLGTLSQGCSDRFKQMLLGKGGDLHTFGTSQIKASKASCSKLNGTMCATQAHILSEKKQTSNGRTMESTMDVFGDSCLPRECMSSKDLRQLTQFMHKQAKNVIPGQEHQLELHVDCTKNGGTTAAAGVPQRSGSTSMTATAVACTVLLALFRFTM